MGELMVTISTWIKGNQELFDGESQTTRVQEYKINCSGIFVRTIENQIYFQQSFNDIQQLKVLLTINQDEGKYVILNNKMIDLWIHIKKEWLLRNDDVIKLGKKIFKVLNVSNSQYVYYQNGLIFDTQVNIIMNDNICRICLSNNCNIKNPLLSICNCCGSTKYVHFDCLKSWFKCKVKMKKNEYYIEINSSCLKCEICNAYYPQIINYENNQLILYNFEDLDLKYHLVLEDIENQKILILNFQNQNILTLGRGHECNIRISEITISRIHVSFFLRNDKIYMEDRNSKFGTLIKVQKPLRIQKKEQIFLQSGKSRIQITHKPKSDQCALLCNYVD